MQYCMGSDHNGYGCGAPATAFEADDDHWHDWLWCDEHAKGRPTEPHQQKIVKYLREEADE